MTQEDYKAARREKTREAAAALCDDLGFFRDVLRKEDPTAGDIRRLSAQLRRILVEGNVERIAGPRIGKIRLLAPVIDHFIVLNAKLPFVYLGAASVEMFGVKLSFGAMQRGSSPMDLDGFDPNARQELELHKFLKQGAIVFDGTWIARESILKYMANVADGIHSGEPTTDLHRLIARARHVSKISVKDGLPSLSADIAPFSLRVLPALISPTDIDGGLMELWSTADLLTSSPDIHRLEAYIQEENSGP